MALSRSFLKSMPPIASSAEILEQFRADHASNHAGDINLAIRPAFLELLRKLGDPHKKLPPTFHVAGTNGKGSVCAFLRAMLEAAGYKVHVYTSPHLVDFHERIRIAGELIREPELAGILQACYKSAKSGAITYFEAATAAAFTAFARHPADFLILEVGLGGRLDATNVIEQPLADIITRISYDHRDYLGNSLSSIAREKAGIMRRGVSCFSSPQPEPEARAALSEAAFGIQAPLSVGGEDWRVMKNAGGFHYQDASRNLDLPLPALNGAHQMENAGLAIAALSVLPTPLPNAAIIKGLRSVQWPARLQKVEDGALKRLLPPEWDLWIDGGHNDSAGQMLAQQAKQWAGEDEDGIIRPLQLICGMLETKSPLEFLGPLAPYVDTMIAVPLENDLASFTAEHLALQAAEAGIKKGVLCVNLEQAFRQLQKAPHVMGRVLVCGSLYLAGEFLRLNDTKIS